MDLKREEEKDGRYYYEAQVSHMIFFHHLEYATCVLGAMKRDDGYFWDASKVSPQKILEKWEMLLFRHGEELFTNGYKTLCETYGDYVVDSAVEYCERYFPELYDKE